MVWGFEAAQSSDGRQLQRRRPPATSSAKQILIALFRSPQTRRLDQFNDDVASGSPASHCGGVWRIRNTPSRIPPISPGNRIPVATAAPTLLPGLLASAV